MAGGTLASLLLKLGLDASGVQKGSGQVQTALGGLNKKVAAGAAFAGAAIGDFAYQGIQAAVQFDDEMRQVFSILPGISKQAMDEMSGQVRSLAVEMGTTTSDISQGLYDALSSGIPRDNVFAFMEIAAKTAKAGVADTASTVKVLAAVTNAYRMTSAETEIAADQMFKAVELGVTTIPELSASLAQVTPLAAAAGVGFDEVLGSITAMTLQGTPTAEAITQIRSAMVGLQKGTPALNKVIGEYGFETSGAMFETLGFQESLEVLRKISEDTGIPLIKLTGRIEGTNAVLQLTGQNADAADKALAGVRDSAGRVDAAFAIMQGGVGGSVRKAQAIVQDFAISAGQMLEPIAPVMMAFGPQMGRWLGRGIGAGLGLAFAGLGTVIQKLAPSLMASLTDLGVQAGGGIGKGLVTSITSTIKSAGAKRLIGGALVLAAGQAMEGGAFGQMGGIEKVGGSLLSIAGAFAIGGPVLAAVVAVMEAFKALSEFMDTVSGAQKELDKKIAAVSEQTGEEALSNLKKMTAGLNEAQGLARLVGDTFAGGQQLEALQALALQITKAETLSVAQIDEAIATIEKAAHEAEARGNATVAASLRGYGQTYVEMRKVAVESSDGMWHALEASTTEGTSALTAAIDQAVALGGDSLAGLSVALGMSVDEVTAEYAKAPDQIVSALSAALSSAGPEARSAILDNLNLAPAARAELEALVDAIDAGGAGVTKAVQTVADRMRDMAGAVRGGWDAISAALAKGPKIQSYKSRLKDIQKAIRNAKRGLARAIKAGDVVAGAEYASLLASAQEAGRNFRGEQKIHLASLKRYAREQGIVLRGAGRDHKKLGDTVRRNGRRMKRDSEKAASDAASATPDALKAETPKTDTAASGLADAAAAPLEQVALDATTWGSHLGTNFANGIRSQYANVQSGASSLAEAVRSRIAFSEPPKAGPLSGIRSWGPHMVTEWVKPMRRHERDAQRAGERLAGALHASMTSTPGLKVGATERGRWGDRYRSGGRGSGTMRVHRLDVDTMRVKREKVTNLHVGILVADDRGLDELDRRMGLRKRQRARGRARRLNDPD